MEEKQERLTESMMGIETRFDSIEEARQWMLLFANWYNNKHLHSGIKYVTPSQRHQGLDIEINVKKN